MWKSLISPADAPWGIGIAQTNLPEGSTLDTYSDCCEDSYSLERGDDWTHYKCGACYTTVKVPAMARGVRPSIPIDLDDIEILATWVKCWTGLENVTVTVE